MAGGHGEPPLQLGQLESANQSLYKDTPISRKDSRSNSLEGGSN